MTMTRSQFEALMFRSFPELYRFWRELDDMKFFEEINFNSYSSNDILREYLKLWDYIKQNEHLHGMWML